MVMAASVSALVGAALTGAAAWRCVLAERRGGACGQLMCSRSDDAELLFERGRRAMSEGSLGEARECFVELQELEPENAVVRQILSRFDALEETRSPDFDRVQEVVSIGNGAQIRLVGRTGDGGSCGESLWASSPALLTFLQRSDDVVETLVRGKRVVELGSGLGLIGMSLAKMGCAHVVLTDMPQQVDLLRANVEANLESTRAHMEVAPLLWGVPASMHAPKIKGCQLVVAADGTPHSCLSTAHSK
ncbi:MAG: hypothetical protein SGPRY_012147 [Prymnesium sp.]